METAPITPPISSANTAQVLFVLRNGNFQLSTDQPFTRQGTFTKYRVLDVIAVQKTGAASVLCAGGIYDAASKGGNALVGVAQSWVTLASGVNVVGTLAAIVSTALLSATPILSLTTGSTGAVTADVFIMGYPID